MHFAMACPKEKLSSTPPAKPAETMLPWPLQLHEVVVVELELVMELELEPELEVDISYKVQAFSVSLFGQLSASM